MANPLAHLLYPLRGEDHADNDGSNYAGKLLVYWTKPFKPQGGGDEYVFSVD